MKILVMGPEKSERDRFITKFFGKDLNLLKEYIFSIDNIGAAASETDITQSYLVLTKNENELHSEEEWLNYYNSMCKIQNIVWVSDF